MRLDISEDSTIRFGDFELESKSGELRKNGRPLKLQPQPSKVLVLLASRPGDLVTREEIQQEVWAAETFVDFEHGLNFCIKQIRTALGDNAQSPVFIETIPRRGYRFIAQVEPIETVNRNTNGKASVPETIQPTSAIESPPQSATTRTAVATWSIAAVILTLTLGLIGYVIRDRFNPVPATTNRKTMLAVLPFDNLSADPQQDYFSDGLTEETITQLGRLQPQSLGVIARTSSMKYKRTRKDIRQIGNELGVDYVLEGSVRRDADKIRVTAQLIQVSDQTHLWAETYELSSQDALKVQDQVAGRVAQSLALELLPTNRANVGKGDTHDSEAHEAYLKGRYLWNKGTKADLEKSVGFFKQAIEKDTNYALAYCGLANADVRLATFKIVPVNQIQAEARAAAEHAVQINDELAEAHSALGSVNLWLEWNWSEADKEFKRAIELNPNYPQSHHDYAWFLVSMGRSDEAITEIKRAQLLDPLSPLTNSDVGWVYLRAHRYDEAIVQIKRTLELEPNFGSALACLQQAYIYKGMYTEAVEIARKEMQRSNATPTEMTTFDRPDPKEGLLAMKRWMLDKALKGDNASPYFVATIYAALGDKDRAFVRLEQSFQEHNSEMVSLKVDPAVESLRGDRRFEELLKRMKLN